MANVPRLSKILRGKDTKPLTELEAAIKYALDNAGGGDTYETVAEIAVGTMESGGEQMPGLYIYSDSEAVAPTLNENETYYLNTADNESNSVVVDLDSTTLRFNASTGEGLPTPLEPDKNMYVMQWAGNGLFIAADTDTISNTTVKILKKASGGETITVDFELSETSENPVQNKVVTAALDTAKPLIVIGTFAAGEGGNPNTVTITTPLADIFAAAQAGRVVKLEYTEDGTTTRLALATYEEDNGSYAIAFSMPFKISGKPIVAVVAFENTLVGAFSIVADAIPTYTADEAGKVLTVNSYGVLEWVTPT